MDRNGKEKAASAFFSNNIMPAQLFIAGHTDQLWCSTWMKPLLAPLIFAAFCNYNRSHYIAFEHI